MIASVVLHCQCLWCYRAHVCGVTERVWYYRMCEYVCSVTDCVSVVLLSTCLWCYRPCVCGVTKCVSVVLQTVCLWCYRVCMCVTECVFVCNRLCVCCVTDRVSVVLQTVRLVLQTVCLWYYIAHVCGITLHMSVLQTVCLWCYRPCVCGVTDRVSVVLQTVCLWCYRPCVWCYRPCVCVLQSVRLWSAGSGDQKKVIWASQSTSIMAVSYSHGYFACSYGATVSLYQLHHDRPTVHIHTYQEHKKRSG